MENKWYFDKNNFKQYAPTNIKKSLPQNHIDVLDGMEVEFSDNEKFGTIPKYYVDNDRGIDSFYLYPVDERWCSKQRQETLF